MKKLVLLFLFILILVITLPNIINKLKYKYIILITLDTLRQDAISCYNSKITYTPNFHQIAQEGIKFVNAYTHIPITLPSHASMLYSKEPWDLYSFFNGEPLEINHISLQEILKKHGYITAAFTSLGVLQKTFGLSSYFDYYQDTSVSDKRPYLFADEVNKEAFAWLDKHYKDPFFMWLHYSDPHEPYLPKFSPYDLNIEFNNSFILKIQSGLKEIISLELPFKPGLNNLKLTPITSNSSNIKIYQIKKLHIANNLINIETPLNNNSPNLLKFSEPVSIIFNNPTSDTISTKIQLQFNVSQTIDEIRHNYAKEVEFLDQQIGLLIDRLKHYNIYKNALLIFIADHGEGLGDHYGVISHESQVYLSQLKIPLIIIDHKNVKTVNELATPIDIAPTILSYLNITNKSFDGFSLLPAILSDNTNQKRNHIKSATFYYLNNNPTKIFSKYSIISKNYHLIYNLNKNTTELYNIKIDIYEQDNIINNYASAPFFNSMNMLLESLKNDAISKLQQRQRKSLPLELKEQLKSLGYTTP
jgi:arylsulfatase A-like enzyme